MATILLIGILTVVFGNVAGETSSDVWAAIEGIMGTVEKFAHTVERLENTVQLLNNRLTTLQSEVNPKKYYMYSSHGCLGNTITLQCDGDSKILLTSADYGEYQYGCTEGCCAPHPFDDCTEVVAQNRPSDWEAMKLACNNKASCSIEYGGSTFQENCTLYETAAYLNIFYSCLPDSPSSLVGFTAYATADRNYDQGELVLFDGIISNIGGHYQTTQSVFLCPYSGLYLFTVTIGAEYNALSAWVNLMLDGNFVFAILADELTTAWSSATNSAVLYCTVGQKVWVESRTAGELMNGGADTPSTFTGFLFQIDSSTQASSKN